MRSAKTVFPFLALLCSSLLTAAPRNVAPEEFQSLITSGKGILLDVRTPEEVAQERIGEPSVIDYYSEDFQKRLKLLPRETPIHVYCRSGARSSSTLKILDELGFTQTIDLAGGIGAWKKAGLPIQKAPQRSAPEAPSYSPEELTSVLSADTPVLLAFQTKWCAPCRAMKPVIDQFEDQTREDLKILRVDLDANESIATRYQVESVPTFILLKNNATLWRDSGTFTLAQLIQILDTHR